MALLYISGFIIEKTGSMDLPYQVVGAAETFGGVLYFSILFLRKRSEYQPIESEGRPIRRRYVSESFS